MTETKKMYIMPPPDEAGYLSLGDFYEITEAEYHLLLDKGFRFGKPFTDPVSEILGRDARYIGDEDETE